jgi:hypothetical protein
MAFALEQVEDEEPEAETEAEAERRVRRVARPGADPE